MGASQKSTGGRKTKTATAPSARKSARGSARSKPRPKVVSVPRDTKPDTAVPLGGRAEAIRRRTPSAAGSSAEPPRYSNRSARPRILEAARKTATEHGYERLRLKHITDEAAISHQAFYGHFANKRHAVAVATSDELGAIADLANRGSKREEEWALRMLADIDRTLAAAYPATDGPERWLRDRICTALAMEGGFGSLRILELIRISTLGHGEFYRRYGGKRGCLQRIYCDALGELGSELEEDPTPARIGEVIAADPDRAALLILGSPHLPDRKQQEEGKATQSSLAELLADLAASQLGAGSSPDQVSVIAAGLLEVIRSAVLTDSLAELPAELSGFELVGGAGARLLVAA